MDSFLIRYYSRRRMLCIERDGGMAAMLHLLPFESELGRTTYIYGVATAPEHRGEGLATELMREAMRLIEERGDDATPVEFVTKDGFDFGTGNAADDLAMVWQRRPEQQRPERLRCLWNGK